MTTDQYYRRNTWYTTCLNRFSFTLITKKHQKVLTPTTHWSPKTISFSCILYHLYTRFPGETRNLSKIIEKSKKLNVWEPFFSVILHRSQLISKIRNCLPTVARTAFQNYNPLELITIYHFSQDKLFDVKKWLKLASFFSSSFFFVENSLTG